MADFVRVSHPLYERTVPADAVGPDETVMDDRDAVDGAGRPLPTKPRLDIGDTTTKAAKTATTPDKKKD